MKRRFLLLIVAALFVPASALAHVEVESGGDGLIVVSVPNESQTADTVEVSIQLPDNVLQAEFPKVAGWNSTGTTEPLSPPLVIDGATVAERVASVKWTGGTIPPEGRAEFRLRVRVRTGTTRAGLAFPAVQRYSDGTVTRWIGPAESDEPAGVLADALPTVEATPVAAQPTTPTNPQATPSPTATATGDDEGGGFSALPVLIIVGVAIAAGAAFGVIRQRRRREDE